MTIDTKIFMDGIMCGLLRPNEMKAAADDDGVEKLLAVIYFGARHAKKMAEQGKTLDEIQGTKIEVAIPADEANEFMRFVSILNSFVDLVKGREIEEPQPETAKQVKN